MKFEPRQPALPATTPVARLAAPSAGLEKPAAGYEADSFRATPGVTVLSALLGDLPDPAPERTQASRRWSKKHPMPTTPKGRATVLSANLREGLVVDPGDVQHTRDMKNFVSRVVKQLPYAPDVLTLNEVVGPSAENVSRLLSERTGHRYVVVQAPSASPFSPGPITRDTAVLVNADTFDVEQRGFIPTTTPKGTNMPSYARLKQKGSQLRLNVASVHFPATSAWDLGRAETDAWRLKIAKQVNAFLERTDRGQRTINVMAGDFNAKKGPDGKENRLYDTLTDRWGYEDSLLEGRPARVERARIDYIFAQGQVVDADKDHTYTREMIDSGFRNGGAKDPATGDKREKKAPKHYYSDHAFEWAVVGKPRKNG